MAVTGVWERVEEIVDDSSSRAERRENDVSLL